MPMAAVLQRKMAKLVQVRRDGGREFQSLEAAMLELRVPNDEVRRREEISDGESEWNTGISRVEVTHTGGGWVAEEDGSLDISTHSVHGSRQTERCLGGSQRHRRRVNERAR